MFGRSKEVAGSLVQIGDAVSVCIEGREIGVGKILEVSVGTNKSALVDFGDGRKLRMNQLWLTVIRKRR